MVAADDVVVNRSRQSLLETHDGDFCLMEEVVHCLNAAVAWRCTASS